MLSSIPFLLFGLARIAPIGRRAVILATSSRMREKLSGDNKFHDGKGIGDENPGRSKSQKQFKAEEEAAPKEASIMRRDVGR